MNGKVTYRQQFTRCGKERCRKCREGTGHGPYWYAYWSENGRTVSKYIGLQRPEELTPNQDSISEEPAVSSRIPSPILRIYALGQFRIERKHGQDWLSVDSRTWHRRRARALLGCLLSTSGRRLGREQIMDLLWPELDIDIAANRLNGAVHELRQILEPDLDRPANSHLLRLEHDILELANNTFIWIDAEAFEQLLKEAHSCPDPLRSEQLYEEAATLYRGSYLLEELYAEWAAPRRDMLQRSWVGLQLNLAQIRAEQGALVSAIETLDRLRAAEPTNETALQRQMLLLTLLDRRGEALQLYRQHRSLLKREYEGEPLAETITLYETLRAGHVPEFSFTPRSSTPSQQDPQELAQNQAETFPTRSAFNRPPLQIGRHNQSPLIGREEEQRIIQQAVLFIEAEDNQTPTLPLTEKQKHPHFLLLRGEPGIGKTRLAEELRLLAYQRNWAVAWTRSYEQERTIPYRPWTELLHLLLQNVTPEELLQITHPEGESQAVAHLRLERLNMLLPDIVNTSSNLLARSSNALPHEQERLLLWEATLGLLETLSKFHPLLLIFDDLHWADDSSIEILTYLAHHLQKQRIFLVATCRDGELPPMHKLHALIADLRREEAIITLPIKPLTPIQIGNLLSHLPQETVYSIQEQAAGNPFFAEELARYASAHLNDQTSILSTQDLNSQILHNQLGEHKRGMRAGERLTSRTSHSHTLPEAISAVLERRLGRLSPDCQTLLSKAAVLGGSFELSQLLPITSDQSEDAILDLLEEALRSGLLTEEGAAAHIIYHFWHPLIISHLYERLSAARRAQLHRKAAEALKTLYKLPAQQEKVAIAIVHHLSRGGGEPAQVAYYAELAGNQAYQLSGYSEARRYYLQAIQALINQELHTPENSDVPNYTRTILPKVIIQQPGNTPRHICRLLEFAAECNMVLGDFEDARFLYQCILSVLTSQSQQNLQDTHDIQVQALLWREIGNGWAATGDYAQAYSCYERGKAVLAQSAIHNGTAWACLHMEYGNMLRRDGQYEEARQYLQEALNVLEQLVPLTFTSIEQKERELAAAKTDERAEQPTMLATRIERALIGDPLEIGYAHERLGIVAASVGQLNEAFPHLQFALRLYEQNGLLAQMVRVFGNLGVAYAVKGENNAALDYTRRSLQLAERIGDIPNQAFIIGNLADMTYRAGKLQEAEQCYWRSLALAEQINDRERISWFHAEIAMVQKDLGKLQEARASIFRAIKIGRAIKSSRCIHYALIGLGDLRIIEAQEKLANTELPLSNYKRLLTRARTTLQRVASLEGLEAEPTIEGKYLLATTFDLLGETEAARQLALSTLKEAWENEIIRSAGRILRLLGTIAQHSSDPTQAELDFKQALQIFHERELHLDYARTLHIYGKMLIQRGTLTEEDQAARSNGLDLLRKAHNLFQECRATLDEKATLQLLNEYEHPTTVKALI
jgi:DNA-binding SARP family transcriptional activator/Flp pilus assembly protein TadD